MLAAIASCRETFVDRRQRALGLTGGSFKLSQKAMKHRGEGAIALTGKLGERFSEVVRASARVVQPTLRPAKQHAGKRHVHPNAMLAADPK